MVRVVFGEKLTDSLGGDPEHIGYPFAQEVSFPSGQIQVTPKIIQDGYGQTRQGTGEHRMHKYLLSHPEMSGVAASLKANS
jgi:hypothetical protein